MFNMRKTIPLGLIAFISNNWRARTYTLAQRCMRMVIVKTTLLWRFQTAVARTAMQLVRNNFALIERATGGRVPTSERVSTRLSGRAGPVFENGNLLCQRRRIHGVQQILGVSVVVGIERPDAVVSRKRVV